MAKLTDIPELPSIEVGEPVPKTVWRVSMNAGKYIEVDLEYGNDIAAVKVPIDGGTRLYDTSGEEQAMSALAKKLAQHALTDYVAWRMRGMLNGSGKST